LIQSKVFGAHVVVFGAHVVVFGTHVVEFGTYMVVFGTNVVVFGAYVFGAYVVVVHWARSPHQPRETSRRRPELFPNASANPG
jgi:hypothetical protein